MTQYDAILAFVTNDLNEDNRKLNAVCYDGKLYDGSAEVVVSFERNHKDLYKRLIQFCAANDMIVISTVPATLATTIRVSTKESGSDV